MLKILLQYEQVIPPKLEQDLLNEINTADFKRDTVFGFAPAEDGKLLHPYDQAKSTEGVQLDELKIRRNVISALEAKIATLNKGETLTQAIIATHTEQTRSNRTGGQLPPVNYSDLQDMERERIKYENALLAAKGERHQSEMLTEVTEKMIEEATESFALAESSALTPYDEYKEYLNVWNWLLKIPKVGDWLYDQQRMHNTAVDTGRNKAKEWQEKRVYRNAVAGLVREKREGWTTQSYLPPQTAQPA